MRRFGFMAIACALVLLCACDREDDDRRDDKHKNETSQRGTGRGIKEENALASLQTLVNAVGGSEVNMGEVRTMKIGRREIKAALEQILDGESDYWPLAETETKAELFLSQSELMLRALEGALLGRTLPDTLVYVASFDAGWAVLAGNTELNSPVLYLSDPYDDDDEDEEDEDDEEEEIGLQSLKTKADGTSGNKYFIDQEMLVVPVALLVMSVMGDYADSQTMSMAESMTLCGPYLETLWGVWAPFNAKLTAMTDESSINNDAASAVIALLQIMAQQEKPAVSAICPSSEYTAENIWADLRTIESDAFFDFEEEKQNALKDLVSDIVAVLSDQDHCNVAYTDNGTACSTESVANTFKGYGYAASLIDGFGGGNMSKIDAMLKAQKPVYMDMNMFGLGWAFVADGMCGDMYHINVGNEGEGNGYIAKSSFPAVASIDFSSLSSMEQTMSGIGEDIGLPEGAEMDCKINAILY